MKMLNLIKTLFISGILTVILFAVSTIELKADEECPTHPGCYSTYNDCCVYHNYPGQTQIDCSRYTDC